MDYGGCANFSAHSMKMELLKLHYGILLTWNRDIEVSST